MIPLGIFRKIGCYIRGAGLAGADATWESSCRSLRKSKTVEKQRRRDLKTSCNDGVCVNSRARHTVIDKTCNTHQRIPRRNIQRGRHSGKRLEGGFEELSSTTGRTDQGSYDSGRQNWLVPIPKSLLGKQKLKHSGVFLLRYARIYSCIEKGTNSIVHSARNPEFSSTPYPRKHTSPGVISDERPKPRHIYRRHHWNGCPARFSQAFCWK